MEEEKSRPFPEGTTAKKFLDLNISVLSSVLNKDNVNDIFNFEDSSDRLLPIAVLNSRCDLVDFLLSLKANPNCTLESMKFNDQDTVHHMTCLSLACLYNNRDVVQKLLQAGADPNLVPEPDISRHGIHTTFLTHNLERMSPRHPLCHALMEGNDDFVDLLMAYGANINFENGNMYSTPFFGLLEHIRRNVYSFSSQKFKSEGSIRNYINTFIEKGVNTNQLIHPYLAWIVSKTCLFPVCYEIAECLLSHNIVSHSYIIDYDNTQVSSVTDERFFRPDEDWSYENVMDYKQYRCPVKINNGRLFRLFIDNEVPIIDGNKFLFDLVKDNRKDDLELLLQLNQKEESKYYGQFNVNYSYRTGSFGAAKIVVQTILRVILTSRSSEPDKLTMVQTIMKYGFDMKNITDEMGLTNKYPDIKSFLLSL